MNPDGPVVSVIMPAYNASRFIGRAIDSVVQQTFRNWELLVVDDGSTDNTLEVVRSLAAADKRIHVYSQENAGVAAARNLAIRNSRGQFIAPLDSDDFWFPRKLEYQVAEISKSDRIGLVYTWWVSLDENDQVKGSATGWNAVGDVSDTLLFINFIGNASVPLFRRSALERVGYYNSAFRESDGEGCEDWDITLRVAEQYDVALTPFYLTGYRAVGASMSTNAGRMARSFELMILDLRNRRVQVNSRVIRWSRSRFYSYIASQSYNTRQPNEALRWLTEVFRVDPLALTSPGILKLSFKSLARSIIKVFAPTFWPQHKEIARLLPGEKGEPLMLEQLVEDISTRAKSRAWFPWKPYDLVLIRRWRILAGVGPPRRS